MLVSGATVPMAIVKRTRSSALSAKKLPPTINKVEPSPVEQVPGPKAISKENGTHTITLNTITLKGPVALVLLFSCFALVKDLLESEEHISSTGDVHISESMKPWLNLAITLASMSIYIKLTTRIPKTTLFYGCIIFYLGFFAVRGGDIVLNAQQDSPPRWATVQIHLRGLVFKLTGRPLSSLFSWTICRHVLVELWGSVVVPVFFWGLANKISTPAEAKWMYPSFGLIAYTSHQLPALQRKYFSQLMQETATGIRSWEFLRASEGLLLCLLICALYWIVYGGTGGHKAGAKQKSQGLNKKYTQNFAILVLSNGIIYSLVEQTWRSKLKDELANPLDFPVLSYTGGEAKVAATLLSVFVLHHYGWGVAAAITPTLLLGWLLAAAPSFGGRSASSYMGAFGYIWCSNAYYSLAYPCKQMAYMPMDEHAQATFKATFDLVVGRYTGLLVQQLLVWQFGSLAASTPYVEAIVAGAALALLYANHILSKEMLPSTPSKGKGKSE